MKTVCIKLNFQYLEWTWKVLVNESAYKQSLYFSYVVSKYYLFY